MCSQLSSELPEAWFRGYYQALGLMQRGAWLEAEVCLKQVLLLAPLQLEPHALMLQTLLLSGRPTLAMTHFERHMALQFAPSAELSYWQGIVRENCGQTELALLAYRQALAQNPAHPDSRLQLARLLLASQPQAALQHYRQLLPATLPLHQEFAQEYAEALGAAGEMAEAADVWYALVQRFSEHEAWRARWLYFQARSAPERVLERYRALSASIPALAGPLALQAASALRTVDQLELAREVLNLALQDPHLSERLAYLLHRDLLLFPIAESVAEIADYASQMANALEAAQALVPQTGLIITAPQLKPYLQLWEGLAWLPYLNLDPLPYRRAYASIFSSLLPPLAPVNSQPKALPRLCFVINSNSAIRAFLSGVFATWPGGQSEVTLAYTAPAGLLPELSERCPDFMHIELAAEPDAALWQLQGFDLIFFSEVHTDRLAQAYWASRRLAPVQLTSWLSSGTTGLDTMDYFLSSALLERGPEAQLHYSEELILLDEIPTFISAPPQPPPLSRMDLGLPASGCLYLCAHMIFKLHPDFDAILAGILQADPEGWLLLQERPQDPWLKARLEARLQAACGKAYERIVWLPNMAHQDYLALLKLADVMLDPFYFGGGTTSFEALALGLPVVTWPGERLHGRITAAYYKQMGLDELIASSPENYLERALALGQDAICNQKLRVQLLLRAHTLFDRQMAVAELAVCLIGLAQKSLKTRI